MTRGFKIIRQLLISTRLVGHHFFIIAKTKNCLQEPASVRLKQFLGYNTCNILNDLDEPNNCKYLHSLTENN